MTVSGVSEAEVDRLHAILKKEAEEGGYRFNPDAEFTRNLVRGLIKNEQRYGYRACPCRLASGRKDEDLDIICPCDYRDADIGESGACYCALYVDEAIAAGTRKVVSVPERRPPRQQRVKAGGGMQPPVPAGSIRIGGLPLPVWRCRVCGYLCARGQPPEICPVCKAKKDRFERFI